MQSKHPCFNGECAKTQGRIHLPVAAACNIQCNYCKRSFDCVNESRPGVTSKVISPKEALERYLSFKKSMPALSVAGIAGPGDPLANIDTVLETLRLIREYDSEVLFCVSTNGLLLPRYAEALARAGVSHLTVTINAVSEKTAARIYKHIDYEGNRFTKTEASRILIHNQLEGLKKARALGMICKVNVVCIQGLNEREIPAVTARVKEAGASIVNIMQHIPVKGTLFESLAMISREELDTLRKECETLLPQMYHCRQCRADAAGLLGQDILAQQFRFQEGGEESPSLQPAPRSSATPSAGVPPPQRLRQLLKAEQSGASEHTRDIKRFAVATKGGVLVDEHFGHVREFSIYEYSGGAVRFREKRPVAPFCAENCGSHGESMRLILNTLRDCAAVLVLRIGEAPRAELERRGIRVVMTYDYIEEAVRMAAKGAVS